MGIVAFLVLGLIVGALAKAIMPGEDAGGFLATTVLGVVGAAVGGFLGWALFGANPVDDFFDWSTWISAIVGSLVVLGIYRSMAGRSSHSHTLAR